MPTRWRWGYVLLILMGVRERIVNRIKRFFLKRRLQPISVFVFHSVSDEYDPLLWWRCDWTSTEQFKRNIIQLKKQYAFVSLPEACEKIANDRFRRRKYAVLTADDGYRSLLNVLPWLEEQKIPITIFVNSKYLDKQSWSIINEEQAKRAKPQVEMLSEVCPDLYLSREELFGLNSPLLSIGMHGYEHLDATKQSLEGFRENVERCKNMLCSHPRYVPYFAYTWGKHNTKTDKVLKEMELIPVLVNGTNNYNNANCIDRICIDGIVM